MIEIYPWLKLRIPKCKCNKLAYFRIHFKVYDYCNNCMDLNEKGDEWRANHNCWNDDREYYAGKWESIDYDVCSLKCVSSYYNLKNYKVKKNKTIEQMYYAYNKIKCHYCLNIMEECMIDIEGHQIKDLPTKKKIDIERNVKIFMNDTLVKDDNGKVEIGSMIYYYKRYYNINSKNIPVEYNLKLNNNLKTIFFKFFEGKKKTFFWI